MVTNTSSSTTRNIELNPAPQLNKYTQASSEKPHLHRKNAKITWNKIFVERIKLL
jgi:hypothetical protein